MDRSEVTSVKVVLEKPWLYGKPKGTLQIRLGTSKATKNLNFDARRPSMGPPYWPGKPVLFPSDEPAVAGDAQRNSFVMPIEDAKQAFGDWDAPIDEAPDGIPGHTRTAERERVAAFWFGYKLCDGDGSMHPPMYRIGVPAVPQVAIYLLDSRGRTLKEDGKEVVIRPWELFDFAAVLDAVPIDEQSVNSLIGELSADEVNELKEILKERARGKEKASSR